MLDIEHILDYYLDRFRHLKTAKTGGQVAPHKPLLLLAVIDQIEARRITSPKIELSDELVDTFARKANQLVPDIEHYRPNIGMPFYHMKSEPFWHLVPLQDGFMANVTAVSSLRHYYKYAEIDIELFDLLNKNESRKALRKALIDTYFKTKDMNRPSLKDIYVALEVLRGIGVEPSEAQLNQLSQFETDLIKQAARAFVEQVSIVRREFMLELDYEPGKNIAPTIVIDGKTLPIALPEDIVKEKARDKQQPEIANETDAETLVSMTAEPVSEQRKSDSSILPQQKQKRISAPERPRQSSLFDTQSVESLKAEDIKHEEQDSKSIPADDFFSSIYDTPAKENKPKRTRQKYSLNGSRYLKKEELVFEIIKLYVRHHPKATFKELQQVFKDEYCSNKFRSIGFLVSEERLDNWYYGGKYNFYHGDDPTQRFVSGDGVVFYHYAQWTHDALAPIIELAESLGYRITTDK